MKTADPPRNKSRLRNLLLYFLNLGATGFGGPVALIGYMRQDLVEERGWISSADFTQGLAFSEMAPGPIAAQLAIYLGYVHSGFIGATAVSVIFILPSFLMVIAIAAIYAEYGGMRVVHALFYGVGAAVFAIVARAAYRLTKTSVSDRKLHWVIYAAAGIATLVTREANVLLFIAAGLISLIVDAPPAWLKKMRAAAAIPFIGLLSPAGRPPASSATLGALFLTILKAGTFVFGSGFAIIPFLYGDVVRKFHWLTDKQFIDAVAVALITPGPAVITVGFIGYLVGGLAGACLASLGAFLPVYLFVVAVGPWFQRNSRSPALIAFSEGITAAAVGSMTGSVLFLIGQSVYDIPTALIFAAALIVILLAKIPDVLVILAAAAAGFLLYKG